MVSVAEAAALFDLRELIIKIVDMGNTINCCLNDTAEEECDGLITAESGFQLLNQNRFSQEYTMRDDLTSEQRSSNYDSQSSFPYSSSENLYINDHDSRGYDHDSRGYEEEEHDETTSFISWNSNLLHFDVPTTSTSTKHNDTHTSNTHTNNNTTTYSTSPSVINPRSWQRLTVAPCYGDGMPVFVKEGISIPEAMSTPSRVSQTLSHPLPSYVPPDSIKIIHTCTAVHSHCPSPPFPSNPTPHPNSTPNTIQTIHTIHTAIFRARDPQPSVRRWCTRVQRRYPASTRTRTQEIQSKWGKY